MEEIVPEAGSSSNSRFVFIINIPRELVPAFGSKNVRDPLIARAYRYCEAAAVIFRRWVQGYSSNTPFPPGLNPNFCQLECETDPSVVSYMPIFSFLCSRGLEFSIKDAIRHGIDITGSNKRTLDLSNNYMPPIFITYNLSDPENGSRIRTRVVQAILNAPRRGKERIPLQQLGKFLFLVLQNNAEKAQASLDMRPALPRRKCIILGSNTVQIIKECLRYGLRIDPNIQLLDGRNKALVHAVCETECRTPQLLRTELFEVVIKYFIFNGADCTEKQICSYDHFFEPRGQWDDPNELSPLYDFIYEVMLIRNKHVIKLALKKIADEENTTLQNFATCLVNIKDHFPFDHFSTSDSQKQYEYEARRYVKRIQETQYKLDRLESRLQGANDKDKQFIQNRIDNWKKYKAALHQNLTEELLSNSLLFEKALSSVMARQDPVGDTYAQNVYELAMHNFKMGLLRLYFDGRFSRDLQRLIASYWSSSDVFWNVIAQSCMQVEDLAF